MCNIDLIRSLRHSTDEVADTQHAEAQCHDVEKDRDPRIQLLMFARFQLNTNIMPPKTQTRLTDGEAGLKDREYRGDRAVDIIPAERAVDFLADEEADVPGEDAPDGCCDGCDHNVGARKREVEGWHLDCYHSRK